MIGREAEDPPPSMSNLPLDTRQLAIARRLLEADGPTSVDDLASELKLTDRMVRYNLASVESALADHGLKLSRRRGVGIWVEGSQAARLSLVAELDRSTGPAVLDPSDRRGRSLPPPLLSPPPAIRSAAPQGPPRRAPPPPPPPPRPAPGRPPP